MIEINNQTKSKINNNLIKETVLGFLKYFKVKKGEVSIAFIGDAKMRKLNKIYRGCDKTTDILSFSEEENKTYLGEVLINYNQIKRQAKKYSSSIKEDLLFKTHEKFSICIPWIIKNF